MTTAQMEVRNDPIAKMKSYLLARSDKITPLLPERWNHPRVVELIVTAAAKNQRLRECSLESVYLAVRDAAGMGLEPVGTLGEGALVPFWSSKKNGYEAQFIPGYRGLISAAKRTGEIVDVSAHVIYEGDKYSVDYGREDVVHHEPLLTRKHDNKIAVWARFKLANGATHYEVMLAHEVETIKKKVISRNGGDKYAGPWVSDEGEMWKKSAVRRGFKYVQPTQGAFAEALGRAVAQEDAIDSGDEPEHPTIDVTPVATEVSETPKTEPEPPKQTATAAAVVAKAETAAAAPKRGRPKKTVEPPVAAASKEETPSPNPPQDEVASKPEVPPQTTAPAPDAETAGSDDLEDLNFKCKACGMVHADCPEKCTKCGNGSFVPISSKDGTVQKTEPAKEELKDATPEPDDVFGSPNSDLLEKVKKMADDVGNLQGSALRQRVRDISTLIRDEKGNLEILMEAMGNLPGVARPKNSEELKKIGGALSELRIRELVREVIKVLEG